MKFENTEVFNFENAIRGIRNAMNSWDKSDSCYGTNANTLEKEFVIGNNDMKLCQQLIKAGSEHRKFLRQIFVSVDITAPMYFFSEFDTYKVGTTANSTSKMHKLASTPISKLSMKEQFEFGDFNDVLIGEDYPIDTAGTLVSEIWKDLINNLGKLQAIYNETKDKRYWKELLRLLPESWLQKRTVTMNYENVLNMYQQRKNHKLTEWSVDFANWVKTLPYAKEFFGAE